MASSSQKLSASTPNGTASGKTEAVMALIRTRLDQMIASLGIDGLPTHDQLSRTLGVSTKTIQRLLAKHRKEATAPLANKALKRGRKTNFERDWNALTDIEKSDKVQAALRRFSNQDQEMVEDSRAEGKNRFDYVRRNLEKNKNRLDVSSCLGDHTAEFSDRVNSKLIQVLREIALLTPAHVRNPNHPAFYEEIQIARYLSCGFEVQDAILQFGPSAVLSDKTNNYRLRGETLVDHFHAKFGQICNWQECPPNFLLTLRIASDLGLSTAALERWLSTTFLVTYQDAMEVGMDEAIRKGIPLNTLRGFIIQESYRALFMLAQPKGAVDRLIAKHRLQDSGLPPID